MFIQTETTPDPARLKFLPGRAVLAEGALDLHDKAEAAVSPLAERLFSIPGVSGVSFAGDSIVVTKVAADWQYLKPMILGAIMEHFISGLPILYRNGAQGRPPETPLRSEEAEAAEFIKEALRGVIDPELGYNIVDLGLVYEIVVEGGGVVYVTMTTTTPGCPATEYLKQGAAEATRSVCGVEFIDVKLTYEPRWTAERMSSEARAYLGIKD